MRGVVLAQGEEPELGFDPSSLLDFRNPHGASVGPRAEKVDVDGRLAGAHLAFECTAFDCASIGITSLSKRCSGSRS